jgi:hypothetical protein
VGRADAISTPIEYVSRDPVLFTFGLGIGNASHSSLGENFQGTYYELFKSFLITSFSTFVLEIGVVGTALIFVLYWLIFRDVLAIARLDERLLGAMAPGWAGCVAVMAVGTIYTTTHIFDSASYFFWYFSGIFAARRMQRARGGVEPLTG